MSNIEYPLIQIFIPTFNRPDLILQSVNSVLNQLYPNIQVIVSDNSTDEVTSKLFQTFKSEKLKYIKRETSAGVIEHFNILLKEVQSKYFMIFHDDDVMFPNFITTLHDHFKKDSKLVAVASNAKLAYNNKIKGTAFSSKINLVIYDGEELFRKYTEIKSATAPLPSYLYIKKIAEKLEFKISEGGKYADVSFLLDLAKEGKILWHRQALMIYNIHDNQVSGKNNFQERMRLINTACKKLNLDRNDQMIRRYRLGNICEEFRSRKFKENPGFVVKHRKKTLALLCKHSNYYFLKAIKNIVLNYLTRERIV